jgi:hypothetical protein
VGAPRGAAPDREAEGGIVLSEQDLDDIRLRNFRYPVDDVTALIEHIDLLLNPATLKPEDLSGIESEIESAISDANGAARDAESASDTLKKCLRLIEEFNKSSTGGGVQFSAAGDPDETKK